MKITKFHPHQKTHWTSRQTKKEKYDMLHIDVTGDIQVMLDVGGINAQGSFNYLEEELVCCNCHKYGDKIKSMDICILTLS